MKWYRLFPIKPPLNRAFVSDDLPKFFTNGPDLATGPMHLLTESPIFVDWDMAFSLEDMQNFAKHCAKEPDRIHTAPYLVYPSKAYPELNAPVWAHRHGIGSNAIPVDTNDPECDYFGFGFTYFPLEMILKFSNDVPYRPEVMYFTDGNFVPWHFHTIKQRVPIHWDVKPTHLHYEIGANGNGC